MRKSRARFSASAVALSLLQAACAPTIERAEVEKIMDQQRQAWNRGDLEAFVGSYWADERLTFCGGGGITRGHEDLLRGYREKYPDAESRGQLSFELLEFRPMGSGTALALGKYRLDRNSPAEGYFTLLLQRTKEGLKITHDHTSESKLEK